LVGEQSREKADREFGNLLKEMENVLRRKGVPIYINTAAI